MRNNGMFIYSAEGHVYLLHPDFTVGTRKVNITGAGIHDRNGEYLGYWDRFNMPTELIKHLTEWTKQAFALEIASRRLKLVKQEAAMRRGDFE